MIVKKPKLKPDAFKSLLLFLYGSDNLITPWDCFPGLMRSELGTVELDIEYGSGLVVPHFEPSNCSKPAARLLSVKVEPGMGPHGEIADTFSVEVDLPEKIHFNVVTRAMNQPQVEQFKKAYPSFVEGNEIRRRTVFLLPASFFQRFITSLGIGGKANE